MHDDQTELGEQQQRDNLTARAGVSRAEIAEALKWAKNAIPDGPQKAAFNARLADPDQAHAAAAELVHGHRMAKEKAVGDMAATLGGFRNRQEMTAAAHDPDFDQRLAATPAAVLEQINKQL